LPAPFPLAIQKKNNLSAKCEAALAEVAESKRADAQILQEKPSQAVAEKTRVSENFSEKKPAPKNSFPARVPEIPKKSETPRVPVHSSVATTSVEKKSSPVAAPLPLDKAVAVVPVALKDYLAERFQVQFSRVVPATTAHVFSAEGSELFVEKNDALPSEDSGEADDVLED